MQHYGLLGKTLGHSFSKNYFTEKFTREGTEAVYHNFEIPTIADFPALCASHPELLGLNVTIPYKEAILPSLQGLDAEAEAVGAVNTVAFTDGKRIGYNTDVIGFRESIKPFLAHGMERALVLGTGGAAKAVTYVLEQIGIEVWHVSRDPSGPKQMNYSAINANVMKAFLLIVNTTPLGSWPDVDKMPELPYAYLDGKHLLYDLVYNPARSAFLTSGEAHGATIVNGLSMLKIQAENSWRIWQSLR